MFKNIVVAVDGSDAGERIISVACDLAKFCKADVTLVHVPQSETAALAVGAVAGLHAAVAMPSNEQIEAAGRAVLQKATTQAAKQGVVAAQELRRGEAADTIVEIANEIGADLIVSGRRGLGGLSSFVLGSTSQRIGHLAKCSCLTVV